MAQMILLTHLLWFGIINGLTRTQEDFFQTDLFTKMERAWSGMCPDVDICVRHTMEPTAMSNGSNTYKQESCCHGCSCHERCHEQFNCCFSNDTNEGEVNTHDSTMECLSVQTEKSIITTDARIPSYRIVTSAPPDGCEPNVICSGSSYSGLNASCGQEPVAPWGNLFPVYSVQHNVIYKNELCACCHGVLHVVPWQPFLICDGLSSMSDQMQLLEDGGLDSDNCLVTFRYADSASIKDRRCYFDAISTCSLDESLIGNIIAGSFSNFTAAQIIEACESGLQSPIRIHRKVYTNMFCLVCNGINEIHFLRKCISSDPIGRANGVMDLTNIFSLDAKTFQKINRRKQIQKTAKTHQVCIREGSEKEHGEHGSCRDILCSSGQIRDEEGDCIFPSKKWYVDGLLLRLKLRYTGRNLHSMMSNGYMDLSELFATLQATSPWPNNWKLHSAFHSISSNAQPDNSMMLIIRNDITNLAILHAAILRSIDKTWKFTQNGFSYVAKQSILEYRNNIQSKDNSSVFIPNWMYHANSYQLSKESTRHASQTWTVISSLQSKERLEDLTKMFTCKQVGLKNEEYKLMADNLILVSNLTKKVLFDAEFELVQYSKDTKTARVCLSDTVFKVEPETSDSQELRNSNCCLFVAVFVTLWITLNNVIL